MGRFLIERQGMIMASALPAEKRDSPLGHVPPLMLLSVYAWPYPLQSECTQSRGLLCSKQGSFVLTSWNVLTGTTRINLCVFSQLSADPLSTFVLRSWEGQLGIGRGDI